MDSDGLCLMTLVGSFGARAGPDEESDWAVDILIFDCIAHDTPSRRKKSTLAGDGEHARQTRLGGRTLEGIEETGEGRRFGD